MKWLVGGAILHSGGDVEGESTVAVDLREGLERGAVIDYGPSPVAWEVDTSSNWMLDRYVREVADVHGVAVRTKYKPSDKDIPADIQAYLEACQAQFEDEGDEDSKEGVVY